MNQNNTTPPRQPAKSARRYDIDWLRVILFTLLIWYHYLYFSPPKMAFDPSRSLVKFIADVMHQWRLPALFAISGMGTAFAFRRRTWQVYLGERVMRLLVPLLFVVYLMNCGIWAPLATTRHLLTLPNAGATGHMWFVQDLFIYSIILTPVFVLVRRRPQGVLVRIVRAVLNARSGLAIMLVPVLLLTLTGVLFKPWWRGVVGMWWEFPWYFLFFAFGYLLLTDDQAYFGLLDRIRVPVTLALPFLVAAYYLAKSYLLLPGLMVGGWVMSGYPAFSLQATLGTLIQAFHSWCWCLFLFSWASRLLNRPSRALNYLNQAVYPVFIAHQPLTYLFIVVLGSLNIDRGWVDFIVGPLVVSLSSLLVFEVAKRTELTRILFGIKLPPNKDKVGVTSHSRVVTPVIVLALMVLLVLAIKWGTWAYWGYS